jgi:tetratricopeptide (TPR) repeat protein
MHSHRSGLPQRRSICAASACILASTGLLVADGVSAGRVAEAFDPLLSPSGAVCGSAVSGPPGLLKALVRVASQTQPPVQAASSEPPLYKNLGSLQFRVTTQSRQAQAYFNQGLRLAFGFNHAEAQRAFQAAQKLDPTCAMCFWGEAYVLGSNINVPMMPEANAPAMAALGKAVSLKDGASPKEQALIGALERRYAANPPPDRAPLDAAYADAMKTVATTYPADNTVLALYAEAAMDTQPWDYWEAGGAKSKGRGADIVSTLETVLHRDPAHAGAIHLYIHAVEASTRPEKALPYANRLAALMPGAGHVVHMPAHIYYRVGMYRDSMTLNRKAAQVDENYFKTSPSDPIYKTAYYPHNIHFVMVSALMGGDGKTAVESGRKLDASVPMELVKAFPILQPIKSAHFAAHARFSDPDTILALSPPSDDAALVSTMYHYARAVALLSRKDKAGAQQEIDAIEKIERTADYKAFEAWGLPARDIIRTAGLVAAARLADANGDLDSAAKLYSDAIEIEGTIPYTEPPYWYYPVRQSLGSVKLRQGKLDEAQQAFRDSLVHVRNNGWALAGLVEVERKRGDAGAEKAAKAAYDRAWFGPRAGPDLARL